MTLFNSITIRLANEKLAFYEAEAMAKNMPLRSYIRDRLENGDTMLEEFSALRRELQYMTELLEKNNNDSNGGNNGDNIGILLEMLLILRQIPQPQKVQLAQAELKRLGYDIYQFDEAE